MKTMVLSVFCLFTLSVGASCARPTEAECVTACRNVAEVHYWHGFNKAIAAKKLAGKQLLAAKAKGKVEFDKALKSSLKESQANCVKVCKKSGTKKEVKCLTESKTLPALTSCKK